MAREVMEALFLALAVTAALAVEKPVTSTLLLPVSAVVTLFTSATLPLTDGPDRAAVVVTPFSRRPPSRRCSDRW